MIDNKHEDLISREKILINIIHKEKIIKKMISDNIKNKMEKSV